MAIFNKDQIKPYLDKELQDLADLIKSYMINRINEQRQGNLIRDGKGLVGQTNVTFDTNGAVISVPPQAVYIDQGRRPGGLRVPIAPLILWLKRYRIVSRSRTTGRIRRTSEQELTSAAWAIQQHIFRFGITPRPFIDDTLAFAEKVVSNAIDEKLLPEIVSILEIKFNS